MKEICLTRVIFLIFVVLVFTLFFIRLILPSQVDDVNPFMNCSEEVLDWGDVYYVVPKFGGVEIGEEWCNEILVKDKEIAMHGVYHTYEEFAEVRSEEYLEEGIGIMSECFGFRPVRFKPGQLAWVGENDGLVESMELDLFWNQVFHKVYHCGDSGIFPNWVIKIF